MPHEKEHVGFIGLGHMGGNFARRVLWAGFPMTALDIDESKMDMFKREGADTAARNPREVGERSSVVIASLHAEDSKTVTLGEAGLIEGMKPGSVFIDLSSTPPDQAAEANRRFKEKGIEMIDAAVSGSAHGAKTGDLAVFVGGEYDIYTRCLPILENIGDTVTYLGPHGNGEIGKMINQMMQCLVETSIYEGLLIAQAVGFDIKEYARGVQGGCAGSWRLQEMVDNIFAPGTRWSEGSGRLEVGENNERYYRLGFNRLDDVLELAAKHNIKLPIVEAVKPIMAARDWVMNVDLEGKGRIVPNNEKPATKPVGLPPRV